MVEVTKDGSSKALVLDCHYPEDEVCRVESWRPGGQWWGASRGLSWFHLADINIFWLRAAKLGRLVGGKGTRLKSEFQAINNPFSSPESGLSWKTWSNHSLEEQRGFPSCGQRDRHEDTNRQEECES